MSPVAAELQRPLKGVQVKISNVTPCAPGKAGRTGLQIVRCFQEKIWWASSFASPRIQKSTKIINGDFCTSWLAPSLSPNVCLIACDPPSLKSHITLTYPPASLEQLLRALWNAVSWAIVLILPQIKLDSQFSHCAFFFQSTGCSFIQLSNVLDQEPFQAWVSIWVSCGYSNILP